MQILIKAVLSVVIILAATTVGKKLPSTAGLIGVMPLAGALVRNLPLPIVLVASFGVWLCAAFVHQWILK